MRNQSRMAKKIAGKSERTHPNQADLTTEDTESTEEILTSEGRYPPIWAR
jgi:hypothetical protein